MSSSSTATPEEDTETTAKGLMKRDRYVATNRFSVRKNQQGKFEKRWATRKSRLAELPGFKYFHLMRRVNLNDDGSNSYDEGETDEAAFENYVSFTIWQKKSDFSAWRKGDAFKEAHGGTSIGAFLSTMVNSAMVLRGPPRPAFYDGLFVESIKPQNLPETVDGWRSVQADGVNTLPAECFVCMEKFFVPPSKAADFEKVQGWKDQKAALSQTSGFVASSLMRRDGQAKGHGMGEVDPSEPTYVATYVFQDRPSFESWAASVKNMEDANSCWTKAPEKSYYEGTLVISSSEGA
jgi:heme-degrading monooxygenase HmoA